MGTNYYVRPPGACELPCDHWVHLGKSSAGWAFTFRAYPEPQDGPVSWLVVDFASWRKLLDFGEIRDEYGRLSTTDELLASIESKRGERSALYGSDFYDDAGNMFCSGEFS